LFAKLSGINAIHTRNILIFDIELNCIGTTTSFVVKIFYSTLIWF